MTARRGFIAHATRAIRWALAAVVLLIAACAPVESPPLRIESPWLAAPPPHARVVAGYARLTNTTDAPIAIVGLLGSAFESLELHSMRMEDGMMRMDALPRLSVAPGETVALEPGGLHLMLHGPRRALAVGDRVQIAFVLEGGRRVEAFFDVRER